MGFQTFELFSSPHVKKLAILLFLFSVLIFCAACQTSGIPPKLNRKMPKIILWAWERPENLRFINTDNFGVAFLSQTLVLQKDEVSIIPRRQPLKLKPETFLIAVTRIETVKNQTESRPALSDSQRDQIVAAIKKSTEMPNVRAVQIDFDALVSERNFYKDLLMDLRSQLPANFPLTITALASWCVSDNWFKSLPIDEAVPMSFRMGADDRTIRAFFASENDWLEPLCQGSYGIALDEPLQTKFKPNRHFYLFNNRPWSAEDLNHLPEGVYP